MYREKYVSAVRTFKFAVQVRSFKEVLYALLILELRWYTVLLSIN